ncbi:RNA polymerase subunit sigma-70, partial [Clavibacter michiganensis subsp. insidiosus]
MTGTLRTRALAAAPPASRGSSPRGSASALPRTTPLPRPTPLAHDLTAARDEKRR